MRRLCSVGWPSARRRLLAFPPASAAASQRVTRSPASANSVAAVRPAMPAPAMTTWLDDDCGSRMGWLNLSHGAIGDSGEEVPDMSVLRKPGAFEQGRFGLGDSGFEGPVAHLHFKITVARE